MGCNSGNARRRRVWPKQLPDNLFRHSLALHLVPAVHRPQHVALRYHSGACPCVDGDLHPSRHRNRAHPTMLPNEARPRWAAPVAAEVSGRSVPGVPRKRHPVCVDGDRGIGQIFQRAFIVNIESARPSTAGLVETNSVTIAPGSQRSPRYRVLGVVVRAPTGVHDHGATRGGAGKNAPDRGHGTRRTHRRGSRSSIDASNG
jgi:hypothetical protein